MERKYWNLRLPTCWRNQMNETHATSSSESSSIKHTPHSLGNSVEWKQRKIIVISKLCSIFVGVTCVGQLIFGVAAANASAVGIQPFNEGTIDTPFGSYDIPRGELDHGITGDGLNIVSEGAGFSSVPPLCNWSVRYSHTDLAGIEYRSHQFPGNDQVYSDCTSNIEVPGVVWQGNPIPARPGLACAILYANSAEIARQCHSITAN